MFKRGWAFLVFVLIFILEGFGAESKNRPGIGFPFTHSYPKSIYKAGNKNWSVTRDESGVMYFGNSEGLLAYDGEYWKLHKMPQNIIVRAVAADKKGKIFVGGFGEFGYWSYNQQGRFVYASLTHLLAGQAPLREEIWKIYVDGSRVIFQSFGAIYIYENGSIKTLRGKYFFLFLLKAGNRFFIEGISKGLYELQGDSLHFIPGSSVLANTRVLSVLPYQDKAFLIGTAQNGIFIYDAQGFRPWASEASDFLKENQLNNGTLVQGRYYAYGTILNGVIVLDEKGRIVQQVNKMKGLQHNTVLSVFGDAGQNLWIGLDNGINRVEVSSPLFYYFDKTGTFGTVYSSIIHDHKIYLGTNQGLFYSNWTQGKSPALQTFDFKIIEGTQGQVWSLGLFDNQVLCGHNDGTFLVNGTQIRKISNINGGWVLKPLQGRPNLLIQGTYNGLVAYKKDAQGHWHQSHIITGFEVPCRLVEEDASGHIWVSHDYRGIFKLSLSQDLKSVKASRRYSQADGLPAHTHLYGFKLENKMVFSSDSGFYIYDEISDRFIKYQALNQQLGAWATSDKIIKAADKKYWFINRGKVALADFSVPGRIRLETEPFKRLNGHMVPYFENISQISKSMYLVSIDDGFVVYEEKHLRPLPTKIPAVVIRKVENTTQVPVTLQENRQAARELEVPYSRNNLRIRYALPYFSRVRPRYQYYLKGYSSGWSSWTSAPQADFINLPRGTYRFLVRAQVGQARSGVTVFRFTILPPWYWRARAFVVYAFLAGALLAGLRYFYLQRLQRDQLRLERKLEQEKQEFLRQEALAHEQRLVKLKNEQLQTELAAKSRELANSALNIISKNELLQDLRHEIQHLKDQTGKKLPEGDLQKIQKIISEGMTSEHDWNLLESSFNQTQEHYFKSLKALYPELSPNDLKFCAYLRMNMSSKEIASLLKITLRAVEVRRYRLRKKLNLDQEKNLVGFLMDFNPDAASNKSPQGE